MPRRWTNAAQFQGGDPKALAKLADELHGTTSRSSRSSRPSRPSASRPERVTLADARALLADYLA